MRPTRFVLLGALFTLLATVSWTRVDAAACNETCCFDNCRVEYSDCLANCERTHEGSCITICQDVLTSCDQLCGP